MMIMTVVVAVVMAKKQKNGPKLSTDVLAERVIESEGQSFYKAEESQNVRRFASLSTDTLQVASQTHELRKASQLSAVTVDVDLPSSDTSSEEELVTQHLSVKLWCGEVLRKYGWIGQAPGYAVRELSIFQYTWEGCKECSGLHGFVQLKVPGSSADDMIVMNANEMKIEGGCTANMQEYQVKISNTYYDAAAPGHARLMMTFIKGIQNQKDLNTFYAALIKAGAKRVACPPMIRNNAALPQTMAKAVPQTIARAVPQGQAQAKAVPIPAARQ